MLNPRPSYKIQWEYSFSSLCRFFSVWSRIICRSPVDVRSQDFSLFKVIFYYYSVSDDWPSSLVPIFFFFVVVSHWSFFFYIDLVRKNCYLLIPRDYLDLFWTFVSNRTLITYSFLFEYRPSMILSTLSVIRLFSTIQI